MSAAEVHRVVAKLSRRRYGVIYNSELTSTLSRGQIRTLVRNGSLEHRFTQVFVHTAVPPSPAQSLAAAIGGGGAAIGRLTSAGHRSAVAGWALIEEYPEVPEILVPGSRRPLLTASSSDVRSTSPNGTSYVTSGCFCRRRCSQ